MERLSTEGKFFHRGCFRCEYCNSSLRLGKLDYFVADSFVCNFQYMVLYGAFWRRFPMQLLLGDLIYNLW